MNKIPRKPKQKPMDQFVPGKEIHPEFPGIIQRCSVGVGVEVECIVQNPK